LQPESRWTLEGLAEAFRSPRFVLYLGRKSCPPGLPLDPAIIEAADVSEMFAARRKAIAGVQRERLGLIRRYRYPRQVTLAVERQADFGAANFPVRRHRRHDEPGDRQTWQFYARHEFIMTPPLEEEPT